MPQDEHRTMPALPRWAKTRPPVRSSERPARSSSPSASRTPCPATPVQPENALLLRPREIERAPINAKRHGHHAFTQQFADRGLQHPFAVVSNGHLGLQGSHDIQINPLRKRAAALAARRGTDIEPSRPAVTHLMKTGRLEAGLVSRHRSPARLHRKTPLPLLGKRVVSPLHTHLESTGASAPLQVETGPSA